MEIIFATNNKGKVREVKEILKETNITVFSLADKNINIEVEEDGKTFEENAYKKAYEVAKITKTPVIADDSGLEVYALDMRPGIYSARYAGEDSTQEVKNKTLLKELRGVPYEERGARFVCVIAYVLPNGEKEFFRGEAEGKILETERGNGGFGYDPLFFFEPLNKTFGELTPEEKNKVSHRAKALEKVKAYFSEVVQFAQKIE